MTTDLDSPDHHLEGNCGADLYIHQLTRCTATLTVVGEDGAKAQILVTPDDVPGLVYALVRTAKNDRAVADIAARLGVEVEHG